MNHKPKALNRQVWIKEGVLYGINTIPKEDEIKLDASGDILIYHFSNKTFECTILKAGDVIRVS